MISEPMQRLLDLLGSEPTVKNTGPQKFLDELTRDGEVRSREEFILEAKRVLENSDQ